MLHFLDFEVFKYNWLVVIADPAREVVIKIWVCPWQNNWCTGGASDPVLSY